MGKKQWTTAEQWAWLEGLIPAFVQAQQEKSTGTFFEDTYNEWHEKWPTPAPTEDDIRHAKGSAEKVLAVKRKIMDNRIKFWFHNHTRGSSSGAGTRGVLKLSSLAKVVQPWQAYLNKFQNTKLKEKIDEAWETYLSEVPEGQKPEKMLFEIRNKLAQQLYEAETAEVRWEVEEHRQKMRNSETSDDSDLAARNKSFQSSIDKLPRTLQIAMESITKQTGWNVLVIVGGPNLRLGGRITTLALHQGTTMDGKTFEAFLENDHFEKKIMSKFDDFLHESFDPAECAARALSAGSKENTPEPEPIASSDSEDDERPRKKAKSRFSSGTPSISQHEFEQKKAKRIARNKRLLLEMGGLDEEIWDVDQEPRNLGRNPDLASLRDVRTETALALTDLTDDAINQPAAGTEAAAKVASPSANNPCRDSSPENLEMLPTVEDGLVVGAVPGEGQDSASSQGIAAAALSTHNHSRLPSPFITLDTPADSFYANEWFASWLAHFRKVSADVYWQALVTEWAQYEALNPLEGRLPTASRPEEVHWWIKRKRLISLLPHIEKPSEFGAVWRMWWVKMQPAWRGGESLVKTLPPDADWEPILRGGSNGLSMVVIALSWWIHATGSDIDHDLELSATIDDVKWVFSELVAMLLAVSLGASKKHPHEETSQEEPISKRTRTAV
ncbi:hypothetical protein BJV78DRAFT_1287779 [Lactifluus subvellereus]|nr:hypothetical protein BJV78DRAFT_1287779 [Lactifluus subvellereus]